MPHRTYRRAFIALSLVLAVVGWARFAHCQQTQLQPTLRQRLVFGLEARRPSELAFIDAVVLLVREGNLPERLVNGTFFWARQRTPKFHGKKLRRPIIYFQPALTMQAARLGVAIRIANANPPTSGLRR